MRLASEKQAQWRRRLSDKEHELAEWQRRCRDAEQQAARARDAPSTSASSSSPGQLSVRLRELERRCKEADERVQRERAGAKERAARDEARIRYVVDLLTQPPANAAAAALDGTRHRAAGAVTPWQSQHIVVPGYPCVARRWALPLTSP